MAKKFLTLFAFLSILYTLHAQQADSIATHLRLAKADKNEFINYSKSLGLDVDTDTTSQAVFAKAKDILYTKPLSDTTGLVLIVSTIHKDDDKLILKDCTLVEDKTNTWENHEYTYIKWESLNPITKELWYKYLMYKKK